MAGAWLLSLVSCETESCRQPESVVSLSPRHVLERRVRPRQTSPVSTGERKQGQARPLRSGYLGSRPSVGDDYTGLDDGEMLQLGSRTRPGVNGRTRIDKSCRARLKGTGAIAPGYFLMSCVCVCVLSGV